MEILKIPATNNTPSINFDHLTGVLGITGRSFPEDAFAFYDELFRWAEMYAEMPLKETFIVVNMDLINASSLKCINKLSSILKEVETKGLMVNMQWIFHDEDIETKVLGESFSAFAELPVEIIPESAVNKSKIN